jgi:hypothetical protein
MPRRAPLRPRRTLAQRLRDRLEAARLSLQGHSVPEIAARLGVSPRQVGYDLALARKAWRRDLALAREEQVAQELAKLNALEQEAWRAYTALVAQEKAPARPPERFRVVSLAERDALLKPRPESWRFLHLVLQCSDRRAKLLGLDAPDRSVRVELDLATAARELVRLHRDELPADLTEEQLVEQIVQDAQFVLGLPPRATSP